MARARLKVFRTRMGFVDAVVAAPSQAAALKAWGVKQNLFAEKMAEVIDEPAAVKAALAKPGVVLQRPVESKEAYNEVRAPKEAAAKNSVRGDRKPAPRPDRTALDAARKAVAAIDADEKRKLAEIGKARRELDLREKSVRTQAEDERRGAKRKLAAAEREFVASGGRLTRR